MSLKNKMGSKKILFIANSPQIGGGNRSLEILAHGIQEKGFDCLIIVPAEGSASAFFRERGMRVQYRDLSAFSFEKPFRAIAIVFKLLILLKRERIGLVHANSCDVARSAMFPARLLKIPVVCHVRLLVQVAFYEWVFRYLPKPNLFIFVSQAIREKIQPIFENMGASSRYLTIHNAVRLSDRSLSHIPEVAKNIAIFANFQKVKGHNDFVKMASFLVAKRDDLRFHLFGGDIGNSSYSHEIKELVSVMGLSKHFMFHGFVDDIIDPMDQMDIIVCPSYQEPFGRTAIEAMSRGKPVVAYAVDGLVEIIEDEVNGYLVSPNNPEWLADSVWKLLEDKALRDKMKYENINKSKETFGVDEHVSKVLLEYKSLIG